MIDYIQELSSYKLIGLFTNVYDLPFAITEIISKWTKRLKKSETVSINEYL